jgi:hypothetical protein
MPYIHQVNRDAIDKGEIPVEPGELNYQLSLAVDQYLVYHGINYKNLNAVMGVLACMQAEIYRRIAAPYEDKKMETNGEVFLAVPHTSGVVMPRPVVTGGT